MNLVSVSERLARSYLFVPGSRPERVDKARASGADVVIADVEDAVAPEDKDRARDAIGAVLDPARPLVVRINPFGSPWFERDLALCSRPGVAAVVLPKAEDPAHLSTVHAACARPVLALIETARGVWNALELARAQGVGRLVFGAFDFRLDLALPDAGYAQLAPYRAQLVLASRVAGLPAPVDSPSAELNDESAVRTEALEARTSASAASCACIRARSLWSTRRSCRRRVSSMGVAYRRSCACCKRRGRGGGGQDGRSSLARHRRATARAAARLVGTPASLRDRDAGSRHRRRTTCVPTSARRPAGGLRRKATRETLRRPSSHRRRAASFP